MLSNRSKQFEADVNTRLVVRADAGAPPLFIDAEQDAVLLDDFHRAKRMNGVDVRRHAGDDSGAALADEYIVPCVGPMLPHRAEPRSRTCWTRNSTI